MRMQTGSNPETARQSSVGQDRVFEMPQKGQEKNSIQGLNERIKHTPREHFLKRHTLLSLVINKFPCAKIQHMACQAHLTQNCLKEEPKYLSIPQ